MMFNVFSKPSKSLAISEVQTAEVEEKESSHNSIQWDRKRPEIYSRKKHRFWKWWVSESLITFLLSQGDVQGHFFLHSPGTQEKRWRLSLEGHPGGCQERAALAEGRGGPGRNWVTKWGRGESCRQTGRKGAFASKARVTVGEPAGIGCWEPAQGCSKSASVYVTRLYSSRWRA